MSPSSLRPPSGHLHLPSSTDNRRSVEDELNSFPQYKATINLEGAFYEVHFLALFSQKKDATPILFAHGWPGSVLEFVPMLQMLKEKYTPATLPHHVIVPSLTGFGFSSAPPVDRPFTALTQATLFDALMQGLGFGKKNGGYLAQGGDVGSFVVRIMSKFEGCNGIHVNFFPLLGKSVDEKGLDKIDRTAVARSNMWSGFGTGYLIEQATKPGTIGAVLESSPVAVLAWIGEKLAYAKAKDTMAFLLAEVSLYWFTGTAATCIWFYRSGSGAGAVKEGPSVAFPPTKIEKPMGYSQFVEEVYPTPISVVKPIVGDLVWSKRHLTGGHFAALERPDAIWEDVTDFAKVVEGRKTKL